MKERESNIELFRIVATLMILVAHCNGWFLKEWGGITSWSADRGLLVGGTRALIQSISCIGVDCFVLISGYFSIRPKLKSIINIYTILLFFYLLCYALSVYFGQCSFSWHTLGAKFFAFSAGDNWFVQCYLFLMLLSPMLNAFVEKCTEKQLLLYISLYMICMFYFSAVWNSTYFYFNKGYSVTTFIGIYLVGRYVHLWGQKRANVYSKTLWWLIFAFCIIAMTIIRYVSNDEERWLSYESPVLILTSATLLICFARMEFHSKLVNRLASSSLAVFIFHTCNPIIDWFAAKDVELFTTKPFGIYILSMGGVIAAIYLVSILLDFIRRWCVAPILNRIKM